VLVPAGELEQLCRIPVATTPRRRCDSSLRDEPRLTSHPRAHQLTYHGVLAPASAWRDLIVPTRAPASTSPSRGQLAPKSPSAPSSTRVANCAKDDVP
jgi:hypothetical protein